MQGTHKLTISIEIKQLNKNGNQIYNQGLSIQFGENIECNGIKDAVNILEQFETLAKTIAKEEYTRNVQ